MKILQNINALGRRQANVVAHKAQAKEKRELKMTINKLKTKAKNRVTCRLDALVMQIFGGRIIMKEQIEKPEIVTEEHLDYLDDLRENGVTNMFGAGGYIQREFEVSREDANIILSYWMKTFSERQAKNSA